MKEYDGPLPGASLLVMHNGHAVVRKSCGLANLEDGVVATLSTNYRLASVTKQFTAAAILFLAHDRVLSLDASVSMWFPALPDGVTIRHLLTHTSGLVDYEDVMSEGTTTQMRGSRIESRWKSRDSSQFVETLLCGNGRLGRWALPRSSFYARARRPRRPSPHRSYAES